MTSPPGPALAAASEPTPVFRPQGAPPLELTWLGAAGLILRQAGRTFLLDPYLSRNPQARPVLNLKPRDIKAAEAIFISHGHFDHLSDVPLIARRTKARVFCHRTQAASLSREGLPAQQVSLVEDDGQVFHLPGLTARAHFGRHVRFDPALVIRTLARVGSRFFKLLPLVRRWPAGQVLAWRLHPDGYSLLHLGSAGTTPAQLARMAKEQPDLLLLPLQGHSRICRIALDHVRAIRPGAVAAQHHDDFFPPISRAVDIRPFTQGVRLEFPEVEVIELEPGRTISI